LIELENYLNLRKTVEESPQQYGDFLLPCQPSPPDKRDFLYERVLQARAPETPLPDKVDYRPNLPPVFNQGSRGSCAACAVAWSDKAFEEISQGDFPANGLSAAYLYAMCKKKDGIPDREGTYLRVAYKVLKDYGVCSEDCLPYSELLSLSAPKVPEVRSFHHEAAEDYVIASYAKLADPTDTPEQRQRAVQLMKEAISREGPIVGALLVCENFFDVKTPDYVIPIPRGRILGGHAVALVGYDDSKHAFILRNSWGTQWGQGGYAYLPYEFVLTHFDPTGGGDVCWYFFESWTSTDAVVPRQAKEIILRPDSVLADVDGREILMDEPARISEKSRMLVPVRFVGGNMGYLVKWEGRQARLIRPN